MKKGTPALMLCLVLLCTACLEEAPQVSTEPSTEAAFSTEPTRAPTLPATQPPETKPSETAPPETTPPVTVPPETAPSETTLPARVLTVCIDAGHQ